MWPVLKLYKGHSVDTVLFSRCPQSKTKNLPKVYRGPSLATGLLFRQSLLGGRCGLSTGSEALRLSHRGPEQPYNQQHTGGRDLREWPLSKFTHIAPEISRVPFTFPAFPVQATLGLYLNQRSLASEGETLLHSLSFPTS